MRLIYSVVTCFALAMMSYGQALTESALSEVGFEQKPGAQISLDDSFRDENGKPVVLRDYFRKKPVVLVLGYYGCPMLCTLTFNGMVESMQDMKWSIGNEFTVIHVSIDATESPALAAAKKQTYLKRYGRGRAAAGWHFLTGDERAIRNLANAIGFHYAYDASVKQYAHPSGLVILSPEGKVSKYLFGVTFAPKELYQALQAASEHKTGSPIERLVLVCFRYSPLHGKYSNFIVMVLRIFAAATLACMVWFFIAVVRGKGMEKHTAEVIPTSGAAGDV